MTDASILYVNGDFLPAAQAMISARDRGFRFGDGVFETIRVVDGVPIGWVFHLQRLNKGLAALGIPSPVSDWPPICRELMRRHEFTDGMLRLAVSRGVGSRGYRPVDCASPSIVMEFLPLPERTADSFSLWLSHWRKASATSMPVQFKLAAHGVNSQLALAEADQHGCDEALLLSQDGWLCEAASGNLFWIADGTLHTPSLACDCLKGTVRHALLAAFPDAMQTQSPLDTLKQAEAVFLTNSLWGVMPVHTLQPMGWSWPTDHPMLREAAQCYNAWIQHETEAHRAAWR